jgi:hypothetical protein
MKHFKVMIGYDDFIAIDETELEKAIYAQIVGNIVVTFKNGSMIGNRISAVLPDWHKAMGWNYAHKLDAYDFDELNHKGVSKEYAGLVGEAKDRVNYFMASGQMNLIGTGAEIKKLS